MAGQLFCVDGPANGATTSRGGTAAALVLSLISALSTGLLASPARAQTRSPSPGQVTPETLKPATPAPTPTVTPAPPRQAPPGAETLTLRVADIAVSGGLDALAAETTQLTAQVKGREVTVAEVYALAGRIEAAYARRGYILARVTVPPQNLSDGATVRLTVVDGVIESVSADAVPERMRGAVQARTAPLVGRPWLTLPQIERALVLAGGLPGVELRSTLSPGDQVGGVRLILEGDYRPVTVGLSADNRLGREFGDWEVAPQVSFNGVLGLGELVYVSAFFHPDSHIFNHDNIRRVAGIGAIVPIGPGGWSLNPEFTIAETNPDLGPGTVRTRGEFRRLAVRLSYAMIRTRRENLELSGSVEGIDETQTAVDFATRLSDDRLRNLTFGADWARAFPGGAVVSANAVLTKGLSALGARTRAEALASGVPFSRQGVTPAFTKLEGGAHFNLNARGGLTLSATGRFQVAISGPLASSEQFNLDPPDALSAFPVGRLTGDSGWTLRSEVAHVTRLPGGGAISPYVFGAAGQAHLVMPTILERPTLSAEAFGGGVRITLARPGHRGSLYGGVEVGRAISNGSLPNATRVMVDLGVKF
jgi:hemolysin activation/secretion protein